MTLTRLASAAACGAIFLFAPASASGTVTCVFASGTATVEMSEDEDLASMVRDPAGNIDAGGGSVDCGAATVTNTDTIVVTDRSDFGGTYLAINTGTGGFAPGLTPEPGSSSEIEFRVDFAGGSVDGLEISSGVSGSASFRSGTFGINLNASEAVGDVDVTELTGATAPAGLDAVTLSGSSDPDQLVASGGSGTGSPATVPHRLFGFGDPDQLFGGAAPDEFFGDSGDDSIFARDGISETIDCGVGADTVETDAAGVDTIDPNCESRLFAPAIVPFVPSVKPKAKPKKCRKGFKRKKGKCKRRKAKR